MTQAARALTLTLTLTRTLTLPLPPTHTLTRFMWQLLRGLHALHEAGVLHRDLKPSSSTVKVPPWQRLAALDSSTLPGPEAMPLGAQPLPRVLELAAYKSFCPMSPPLAIQVQPARQREL